MAVNPLFTTPYFSAIWNSFATFFLFSSFCILSFMFEGISVILLFGSFFS